MCICLLHHQGLFSILSTKEESSSLSSVLRVSPHRSPCIITSSSGVAFFNNPRRSLVSRSKEGSEAPAFSESLSSSSPMTVLSLTVTLVPFFYAPSSTTWKSRASFSLSLRPELRQDRRRSIEAMSRDINSSDLPQVIELEDESDFEKILSSENRISITGFGSLLSERSARSTFPDLENFRIAKLQGFRRVFAHSAPIFFERGIANPETKEISSLSVEPCEGESLVVTVFEIKNSEIPAFIRRELEFRFLAVVPETMEGKRYTNYAVLCGRYSDEEFFQIRCKGNKEVYFQHYGRFNIDKIWRDDILPCRLYLRHCVLAAKNLGDEAYNNFLDHTYLGDRRTTIREYLSSTGSGIMEEEPPEALKSRYGG